MDPRDDESFKRYVAEHIRVVVELQEGEGDAARRRFLAPVSTCIHPAGRAVRILLGPEWWAGVPEFTLAALHLGGVEAVVPGLPFRVVVGASHVPIEGSRLLGAAKSGDIAGVCAALSDGVSTEETRGDGSTALSLAAAGGHEDVVAVLLGAGANVRVASRPQRTTPLHEAAVAGHTQVVSLLLAHPRVQADAVDATGATPLVLTCLAQQPAVASILVASPRVDPRLWNVPSARYTPALALLLMAASTNSISLLRYMLDHERVADISMEDCYGQTPLHSAASAGHAAAVEVMLASGRVDLNAPSKLRHTPLSCAVSAGSVGAVRALLRVADSRVIVDSRDASGQAILHVASCAGFSDVVRALLSDPRVDVNAKDEKGLTALHVVAAKGGCPVVVRVLLDAGADPSEVRGGFTPLHYAAGCRDRHGSAAAALVRMLLEDPRVDPNRSGHNGATPLHLAVLSNPACFEALMQDPRVDFNKGDAQGNTPLHTLAIASTVSGAEVIGALSRHHAARVDVNARNGKGFAPLHEAAARFSGATVGRALLAFPGIDSAAKEPAGLTALQLATMFGYVSEFAVLLRRVEAAHAVAPPT